jgi:hypothetical protein
MRGWIVRIAIIAAIAGGAFIFRDRISGNAGDLKVGDCFDEPQGLAANAEIDDVQHHPCNESHTGEVIFVDDLTATGTTYPSDDQFTDFIISKCVPAFNTYTGKDFQTDTILDVGSFLPTAEGWKRGDHEVTCYAIRLDKKAVTTSFKVAP